MPSMPRGEVFDPTTVGIYHCWNRCSQRCFLMGYDTATQQDFNHRKGWVRDGMQRLAAAMAVDVLDYAVLDNHLHVVLRNRPDLVEAWSDEEVVRRWWLVCPERRDSDGGPAPIEDLELKVKLADRELVAEYRRRLSDISWFMRQLCQPIATRANKESNVRGRFFAHRFGCDRILDLAGLLACSMYVDLNLVRAGIALTPEDSEFTSACDRIRAHMGRQRGELGVDTLGVSTDAPDAWLAPLFLDERADAYPDAETLTGPAAADVVTNVAATAESSEKCAAEHRRQALRMAMGNPLGAARASNKGFLQMTVEEYLTLLDWTGRQLREGKHGVIPAELASILQRLGIRADAWVDTVGHYDSKFRTAVGRVAAIRAEALRRGRRWLQGLGPAAAAFL